jgi:hypothetical protein
MDNPRWHIKGAEMDSEELEELLVNGWEPLSSVYDVENDTIWILVRAHF